MKRILFLFAGLLILNSVNAQAILSDSLLNIIPAQDFINQGIPGATYDVEVRKIVYSTLDVSGEPTVASGLLSIPITSCALPVFVYCHGTVFLKEDVPSRFNSEGFLGAAAASNGYVSILPDYLGLGDSPGLHPYVHANSQAEASFNMIRAAEEFCFLNDIELNGQLFLTGYSQGGHASMGLLKFIQEYPGDDFVLNTIGTSCGSGPYDISGEQLDFVMADEPYPTGSYLPYVLLSYQSVYGDLYNDLSEVFLSPFDTIFPSLFDGTNSGSTIQSFIPAIPNQMFTPDILLALEDSLHPINIALRDNDLWNWTPQSPVRMVYCTGDEQVVYTNSLKAETQMLANGATEVSAVSAGTGDHSDCFEPYLLSTLLWFNQLREDCVTGLNENELVVDWGIYPNPTESKLFLSFESTEIKKIKISVMDLTGKVIFEEYFRSMNQIVEIDLSEEQKGIYLVQLESNDFLRTKKVIRK